jgi:ankyrin repeat protein
MMGHTDIVWKLIRMGASLGEAHSTATTVLIHSAVQHGNLELLDLLQERGVMSVEPDTHGRLPLLEAVRAGQSAAVEWLLQHGANVSTVSPHGEETAVSVAAFEDRFPIMWRLVEAGGRLDALNEYGGSVLMSAVHLGRQEEVARLIEAGLDVNHANRRGDTPLTLAASRGDVPMLELLLKHGAHAEKKGTRMDSALSRAARFRRGDAVRLLLDRGVMDAAGGIDAENKKGDTALIEACRIGSEGVAELLISRGANVHHANGNGMTPLLEAAEAGSLELLQLLRRHRAELTVQNKHGHGPFELARWTRRYEEIATFLRAEGGIEPKEDEH